MGAYRHFLASFGIGVRPAVATVRSHALVQAASVTTAQVVRIRGRVVLHDETSLPAARILSPFSGRTVAGWFAECQERHTGLRATAAHPFGKYDSNQWRQHFRVGELAPFTVDDGSGRVVHVRWPGREVKAHVERPWTDEEMGRLRAGFDALERDERKNARFYVRRGSRLEVHWLGALIDVPLWNLDGGYLDACPPEFDRFMRANGVPPTQWMARVGDHRFLEARIEPGAWVDLVGPAERVMVPNDPRAGYRNTEPDLELRVEHAVFEDET